MTSINTQDFKRHGTVGVLGPSTECKLQGKFRWAAGQKVANGRCTRPRICVLLGSSSRRDLVERSQYLQGVGLVFFVGLKLMISYFKQDELTKETITEDGWYKTGDIGQWESDGTLSIIDRIKNLVSLFICGCTRLIIG